MVIEHEAPLTVRAYLDIGESLAQALELQAYYKIWTAFHVFLDVSITCIAIQTPLSGELLS